MIRYQHNLIRMILQYRADDSSSSSTEVHNGNSHSSETAGVGGMRFSALVNARRIALTDAPLAYQQFAAGAACKFVFDPSALLGATMPLQQLQQE